MFVPSRAMNLDASDDGAFAFVTYLGSSPQRVARDPRLRVVVRSRATSAYHKAVLQPPPKATRQGQDDDQPTSQRNLMGRFRLRTAPKAKTKGVIRQAQPVKPVVQHLPVLDPFVSSLGPSAWHLLHYCRFPPEAMGLRYSFRQKSMSISGKKDWFAFFISDTATAHATLAFISLNEDLQRGGGTSATTLHHKSAAIRLARERILSKGPAGRGLDEVIGTVATLLITEVSPWGQKDVGVAY
ncbi:hypothetical protein LTR85_008632 [Meristemomyces frigidus]|nr:hypothetical protein LTR85_008632 [Meristemomyces frigidus]